MREARSASRPGRDTRLVAVEDRAAATDRWFVRRGLPHAIPGYSATEDVWTRAWPFLLFILFVQAFASFGDRFTGWRQAAAFVAGLALLAGGFVVANVLRGRSARALPDDIAIPELAVFLFGPALIGLWFTNRGWGGAIALVLLNAFILAIVYAVTSYGLVPAFRVGLGQAIRQVRTITQLVARGLPLLLLITAFVFLNAEMWQVAHDFPPAYYAICVAGMVTLAFAFLALRLPKEIVGLARFDSWDECCELAAETDAPIGHLEPPADGKPPAPDLGRVERLNIAILLTISQAVQTVLVGIIAGAFYVLFGLLAVRTDTIEQWTTAGTIDPLATLGFLGDDIVITWEHLSVAGFIAAFSVLQFSVSSVTDAAYREEFYDDIVGDVRGVLAVRAVVRAARPVDV